MSEEREPEQLRDAQDERVRREAELAEETPDPQEQRTHERRAEQAEYLREKLDEQADSS